MLGFYRKKATFDAKKLRLFLQPQAMRDFENKLFAKFKEFPLSLIEKSLQDERYTAYQMFLESFEFTKDFNEDTFENFQKRRILSEVMANINLSAGVRLGVMSFLLQGTFKSIATQKQQEIFKHMSEKNIFGTFCMTEIGHGSNIKNLKTRASFDVKTQEFILHSPDFQAAKCWAGLLAETATYAVVFAQLYLNNEYNGLHVFLVPIRDPKTFLPYPGIFIGDMGQKIGLNGIDNGFMMFDNYRIPRNSLLSNSYEVTSDGNFNIYGTFNSAAMLGMLLYGRSMVCRGSLAASIKALTIAIRYAAVRRQFGPDDQNEISILEYQSHQYRVLPYLAAAIVMEISTLAFHTLIFKFKTDAAALKEIHVNLAGIKSLVSWQAQEIIQQCREACGGHGYLKSIGNLRDDNDAQCTYEGANNVLLQQTSNWLLKFWPKIEKGEKIDTPLKSVNFLSNALNILKTKFSLSNFEEPENILKIYQWLVCYLLRQTREKFDRLAKEQDQFSATNNIQVFYANDLVIAYTNYLLLQNMLETITEAPDVYIRGVLVKNFSLYGLWFLEKNLKYLYEGGYITGAKVGNLIKESILKLCSELKDEAVALIDALAPPDYVLQSVLGISDGKVYERLKLALMEHAHTGRPSWWQEIAFAAKTDLGNKL